jgi:hypothetical protein
MERSFAEVGRIRRPSRRRKEGTKAARREGPWRGTDAECRPRSAACHERGEGSTHNSHSHYTASALNLVRSHPEVVQPLCSRNKGSILSWGSLAPIPPLQSGRALAMHNLRHITVCLTDCSPHPANLRHLAVCPIDCSISLPERAAVHVPRVYHKSAASCGMPERLLPQSPHVRQTAVCRLDGSAPPLPRRQRRGVPPGLPSPVTPACRRPPAHATIPTWCASCNVAPPVSHPHHRRPALLAHCGGRGAGGETG